MNSVLFDSTATTFVPSNGYPYNLEPVFLLHHNYSIENDYNVLGGKRYVEYTTGISPYQITDDDINKSNIQAKSRRKYIHKTMEFVWSNYVQHAFGMDELEPISGIGNNVWGGQGTTLIDSLDTLWLMNMTNEFYHARDYVKDHIDYNKTVGYVSVFETTIRDLGGLLSAYDWSGDEVFLNKALDLGERLLKSFDNVNTGIPYGQVNLQNGKAENIPWTNNCAILAEFGTLQMEFKYLAKMTNRPDLAIKTDEVFQIMYSISPSNGLYPYFYKNQVNENQQQQQDDNTNNNGNNTNLYPEPYSDLLTFGAMADSFYEYMLKLWIQTDKKIPMYREMYDKAMDGMHHELLQKSVPSGLVYIADKYMNNDNKKDERIHRKMDHLVCFMGGLLALGAYTDPNGIHSPRAHRDLKTAKALTYTCYQMYARMSTGIAPEYVDFVADGRDFVPGASHYLLRPEFVESLFILHQLTKDPVYREWGWEVYQSIEKYCKTTYGYGSLENVNDIHAKPRDKMESFFLAETLKYLYLLQDPDTPIDILNKHVFNTEAHPLRIFSVIDADK